MSSANVFLRMAQLDPEPATPVRLMRHATGRSRTNGQAILRSINGDRYAAFKGISSAA